MNKARKFLERFKRESHRYRWLLRHGIECGGRVEVPQMEKGACFYNAFMLCHENRRLVYVEGIAVPQIIGAPIDHAWCVDCHLQVYDPTWEHEADYFGVPLKRAFIYGVSRVTNRSGPYIDDWMNGWPLIQGKCGPATKWKHRFKAVVKS